MAAFAMPIEQRLRRLEARAEISDLIARYAIGADRRNDPALMGPLFLDDASWSAAGFAALQGRDAIARGLAAIAAERVVWSIHFMVSPLITLSEDATSAHCQWYVWELCSLRDDSSAEPSDQWLGGWYHSEVAATAAGWKFRSVVLDIRMQGNAVPPWSVKKQAQI